MKMRVSLALGLAFLVVNLVEAGAGVGALQRKAGGQCGTAPCWSTFTINGNAPPAGISLSLNSSSGQISVSLTKTGSTDLSPSVSTSDTIHMVLNLGTFDPVIFGTTGLVSSYSETTGGTNTITLDMKTSASSWKLGGCTVVSCGSDVNPVTASNDFASVAVGFVSDLSSSGATQATKDAMRGSWFSTNAQSMTLPSFDPATSKVSFTVAAPHFKTDGTTLNSGFFEFFATDALVQSMGVADPTTVNSGTFTVSSSNNNSTTFSVAHQASPAGVLIQAGTNPPSLPMFSYSSPTFTVQKAATVPGAPTGVSAATGDAGQATVSFSAPSSNGGAAISSYTVTSSPGGTSASGAASPITVGGLTPGASYTFTVTATNSVGTGAASSASNAVVPNAPAVAPTSTTSDSQTTTSPAAVTPAVQPPAVVTAPVTVTAQTGETTAASITAGEPASVTLAAPAGAATAAAPSVSWSSGTFGSNVDVTAVTDVVTAAATPQPLNGFAAGSVAVELTFTSGGNEVHSFAEPLEVVFPLAASGLAPGYSNDGGATWTSIPRLSGVTLPAGQADGYYVDGAGSVHILTMHATYFGLLAPLVLKTWNRASFPADSRRIFVYLAPERKAAATVTLETHAGAVLSTLSLNLPAQSTKLKIPLPAGLMAGIYLVKVNATSGPSSVQRILVVRLVNPK